MINWSWKDLWPTFYDGFGYMEEEDVERCDRI